MATALAGTAATSTAQPRWYIIHVYSGFEKKVQGIEVVKQAEQKGFADLFDEVLVPIAKRWSRSSRGKKVQCRAQVLSGLRAGQAWILNDETWSLVRNIAKVTGFLGPGGKPSPISEIEAERIRSQMQEATESPKMTVTFVIGDQVRVAEGPFASFSGTVEEVDEGKGRLKVSVSIFGRATPVELEYSQVERT